MPLRSRATLQPKLTRRLLMPPQCRARLGPKLGRRLPRPLGRPTGRRPSISFAVRLKKTKRRSRRRLGRPDAVGASVSPRLSTPEHSRRLALLAAQAGLDKKAVDVAIVDVTGKVDYADYLVLMTGRSDRHVTAIAGSVDELLAEHGSRAISVEGLPAARWVLIDLVDVVVHVFLEETRALYYLDGLWMDARRLPVPTSSADSQ